ncbi:MAG: hypothetical protein M3N13_03170 [Candidatus Eremiobacteraeota bacterium]|nr:hypothetical protein [Candidatus Eremiobacteraeota bacterium]
MAASNPVARGLGNGEGGAAKVPSEIAGGSGTVDGLVLALVATRNARAPSIRPAKTSDAAAVGTPVAFGIGKTSGGPSSINSSAGQKITSEGSGFAHPAFARDTTTMHIADNVREKEGDRPKISAALNAMPLIG